METLWVGLCSPSISTLLRYRAREKPTLWGAHSSCPLQEVAVVSCRGAARSSSLLTPTTCGTPAASSATPEKQRRNPTAPRLFPECCTPHSHLAGCKCPGTLRGAEKEMTYYCLLFCSAHREGFIADGTHGNVAPNREKENAAGKYHVHQTRNEEAECPCFPDLFLSSHMVTPHMNMSS